jgi:hypothetical protein
VIAAIVAVCSITLAVMLLRRIIERRRKARAERIKKAIE